MRLVGLLRSAYAGISATVPLAERGQRIADAEQVLERLQRDDEARTDAAGLTVLHRADVVTRREGDAHRAQRDAELERERAARLRAIDQEHEAG